MARSNNILVSNAGIKLVSLALAVLLEFYFYSQDNSTTQLISAVLEFQNVPPNRMIIDPANAEEGLPAHIEVSGPKSVIRQISQGFHVVKIPFPEESSNVVPFDINYDSLKLPPSVKILSAKPARVTIRTVELLHKEIPVEVSTEGILPNGYELKAIKVFPKTVIAKGPMQEIQRLESIKLDTLNLTGLSESVKYELKIKEPEGQTLLSVNIVSVEIVIEEKVITKEFKNVAIVQEDGLLSIGKKYSFKPSQVSLTLKGKFNELNKLGNEIKVVPKELTEKSLKKVALKALVGNEIEVLKINPAEVSAKIKE